VDAVLQLEEAPLLARLSRVDLARLLPDLQEVALEPGESLDAGLVTEPSVFIVRDGILELLGPKGSRDLVLETMSEGDLFGEEALAGVPLSYTGRAVTSVHLYRVPATRLRGLTERHPELSQEVLKRVSSRLASSQNALLRARVGLVSYSEELWAGIDAEIAATDLSQNMPKHGLMVAGTGRDTREPWSSLKGTLGPGVLASFAFAGACLWFLPRFGWERPEVWGTAMIVWALINWALDSMPDYVVALSALSGIAAVGVVPVSVAFSGFANSTWFLSLAMLGVGAAIGRSGLLFRVALHMLRLLPATYWGQSLALALSGLILTPALPSPSGRVAIASPLAMELAEAMRLQDRSRGAAGLGMTSLLGFGQMYFLFLNGTGSCILLWSLLPDEVRARVTWGFWLLAALPLGLVVFGGTFLAIMWLFRPELPTGITRETVTAQLDTLGPLSRLERTTLAVVAAVLMAFVTQGWHHLDPAWAAMAGLTYLVAAQIIDREAFKRSIDWNFLMLYGGLIGVAEILDHTGLTKIVSDGLAAAFRVLLPYPAIFLLGVALMTVLIRVAMPMVAASLLMAVTLYPLAVSAGISPFLITLTVQVASNPWFLAHQNTFYQTALAGTNGRAFTHEQVRPLAYMHAAVSVLSILAGIPLWRWLGLLP